MKLPELVYAIVILTGAAAAASNPVPLIYQPLTPATVQPGQAAFVLTARGTGFVQGAAVQWNGKSLKTKFVSAKILSVCPSPRRHERRRQARPSHDDDRLQ